MSTAKSLQIPKILSVDKSVIRIQYPDISNYPKTYLGASLAAAGTAASFLDNQTWVDDDWGIMGEIGDEKTEEFDVNDTVTRGTTVTITNTNKFAHEVDCPVTHIRERGFKIYGAATDGGSGTLIASIDAIIAATNQLADTVMMQWSKPENEYLLKSTDTANYNYFYAVFTDGTTDSSASDYVASTGLTSNSANSIIESALDLTGATVGSEITIPFLVRSVQDWQDYVTQWVDPQTLIKKDWSFEYISGTLSATTLENSYVLSGLTYGMKYGETKQSILDVTFGTYPCKYIPIDEFDRVMEGRIKGVATAASIGAITFVIDDTSEFADDGTITCGANTITYTSKSDTTNTFSGIPASGTGSITATITAGQSVWQNTVSGLPKYYSIFNGYLYFVTPPSSDYDSYPIRIKYIKALTAISEVSDVTEIPFYNNAQYYVAYRIELKRGNIETADYFKSKCDLGLQMNSKSDMSYTTEPYEYRKYQDDVSNYQDWHSDVYTYN